MNSSFQKFCREALVWQALRHASILPFLGIDRNSFPSSFCMVSPWMKYGTILKYLHDRGRKEVMRLVRNLHICMSDGIFIPSSRPSRSSKVSTTCIR